MCAPAVLEPLHVGFGFWFLALGTGLQSVMGCASLCHPFQNRSPELGVGWMDLTRPLQFQKVLLPLPGTSFLPLLAPGVCHRWVFGAGVVTWLLALLVHGGEAGRWSLRTARCQGWFTPRPCSGQLLKRGRLGELPKAILSARPWRHSGPSWERFPCVPRSAARVLQTPDSFKQKEACPRPGHTERTAGHQGFTWFILPT